MVALWTRKRTSTACSRWTIAASPCSAPASVRTRRIRRTVATSTARRCRQCPRQASAAIGGRHVDLTATVTLAAGDEGVLFATGTQNSGISMFVQGGKFLLDYNAFSNHTVLESGPLPEGDVVLEVQLRRGQGMLGRAEILVNGEVAAGADLGLFMRMISSIGPSVGSDHGSAVSERYAAPFDFTGVLHEVVIQASPEKYADNAAAAEHVEMSRQ